MKMKSNDYSKVLHKIGLKQTMHNVACGGILGDRVAVTVKIVENCPGKPVVLEYNLLEKEGQK